MTITVTPPDAHVRRTDGGACVKMASDVRQYNPLKALHDYWGEGDWALVIEEGNGRFYGDRDDGSGLKAGGNCSLLQGEVEDVCKNSCSLFGT